MFTLCVWRCSVLRYLKASPHSSYLWFILLVCRLTSCSWSRHWIVNRFPKNWQGNRHGLRSRWIVRMWLLMETEVGISLFTNKFIVWNVHGISEACIHSYFLSDNLSWYFVIEWDLVPEKFAIIALMYIETTWLIHEANNFLFICMRVALRQKWV